MSEVIPGVKPPTHTAIRYVGRLPEAPIPDDLARVLDDDNMPTGKRLAEIGKIMPSEFDAESYGPYFKLLLWMEEHKAEYISFLWFLKFNTYTCHSGGTLSAMTSLMRHCSAVIATTSELILFLSSHQILIGL